MRAIGAWAIALLSLAASSQLQAEAGYWSGSGPFGGPIYDVIIDPATPSVVYASTRGGLYRSDDSGSSWQRKDDGVTAGSSAGIVLAADPDLAGRLLAVDWSFRVFRSSDRGDNWTPTGFVPPTGVGVISVADVPGVAGSFYVLTSPVGVYKTTDNGSTFTEVVTGIAAGATASFIRTDRDAPNVVFVGVSDYYNSVDPAATAWIWRSLDGGASWAVSYDTAGFPANPGFTEDLSFGAGSTIYATASSQVLKSIDNGMTWSVGPVVGNIVKAHPTIADSVFVAKGYSGGAAGDTFYTSTDGGLTFSSTSTGLQPNTTYGGDAAITKIELHPNFASTPRIFLATSAAGIYFSNNGGVSFVERSTGIAAVNVRALTALPDPGRWLAGNGDAFTASPGIFSSANSGLTWSPANDGLRAYNIRAITLDPTTGPLLGSTPLYAGGQSATSSFGGLRNGGLYKSTDGGSTWSVIDAGLPTSGSPPTAYLRTVRTIALDPRSCASPPISGACTSGPLQTVFATATGTFGIVDGGDLISRETITHRIIKSTDAGASWTASDTGLPAPVYGAPVGISPDQSAPLEEQITPVPLVLNATNPQIAYVGTFLAYRRNADIAVVPPSIVNGVFKTVDGGASWTPVNSGLPRYTGSTTTALDVLALAIHPSNPDIVWATLVDLVSPTRVGYIYKTTNGGASWTNVSTGLNTDADIRALIVDQGDPNILYAAGAGTVANPGAVYKSSDGGLTWLSLSVGLPADAALSLALDPLNSQILYAGTNAAVWQIEQVPDADGDGAPDQTEGNAPNGGDGNGDGDPDSTQSNVGSSIVQLTRAGQSLMVAGSFTAEVVSGIGANCSQMVDVQGQIAARSGRDYLPNGEGQGLYYAYPQDLVRFELPRCEQVVVDLTFHAPGVDFTTPGWTMRMYGPSVPGDDASMGWHALGSIAQRLDARTWRLSLNANSFGSYRPDSDAILFVGGPAFFDTSLFADGFEN